MNLREQLDKRRALYVAAISAIDQLVAAMAALAPPPPPNARVSDESNKAENEMLFGGGHGDPS